MMGADKTLTIRTRTSSVDAEGQVSYSNSDSTVRGRFTIVDVDETNLTRGPDGMRSSIPEAVAWVPLGTTITDAHQIVISGYDTFLNDTWDIYAIHYARNHYRVFCRGELT